MGSLENLPPRIDVHSHFLPPDYSAALAQKGHSKPDGMPEIPPWSLDQHLDMMATANVTKSILSISSPGTHLVSGNNALARDLTRHCNSYTFPPLALHSWIVTPPTSSADSSTSPNQTLVAI